MKQYRIKKPTPPAQFFAHHKNYDPLLLTILWHKKIRTAPAIQSYLFPKLSHIEQTRPRLLTGYFSFIKFLGTLAVHPHHVSIYGDFDLDGISSAYILRSHLEKLGLTVSVYIPDREKEGYGLNIPALKFLSSIGVTTIITVDCGISNAPEISYAKTLGITTIVIDHHVVHDIPPAEIVIDPYMPNDRYPFKKLACAGLVYKICFGITQESRFKKFFPPHFSRQFLDLVAFATIADYMELSDENRALVHFGLLQAITAPRPFFQYLLNHAHLAQPHITSLENTSRANSAHLSPEIVKMYIVPRMNVAGRVDHANITYKFITATNSAEVEKYGARIEDLARKRQILERTIYKKLLFQIKRDKLDQHPLIIVSSRHAPLSILGILSSKLCDRFQKPALVIYNSGKILRGSARSPRHLSILTIIKKVDKILIKYGGHSQACGFEFERARLAEFTRKIMFHATRELKNTAVLLPLVADAELTAEHSPKRIATLLRYLEPIGVGNELPLFLIKNVRIISKRSSSAAALRVIIALGRSTALATINRLYVPATPRALKFNHPCTIVCSIKIPSRGNKNKIFYTIYALTYEANS